MDTHDVHVGHALRIFRVLRRLRAEELALRLERHLARSFCAQDVLTLESGQMPCTGELFKASCAALGIPMSVIEVCAARLRADAARPPQELLREVLTATDRELERLRARPGTRSADESDDASLRETLLRECNYEAWQRLQEGASDP